MHANWIRWTLRNVAALVLFGATAGAMYAVARLIAEGVRS